MYLVSLIHLCSADFDEYFDVAFGGFLGDGEGEVEDFFFVDLHMIKNKHNIESRMI
jgi:hypothetical protein